MKLEETENLKLRCVNNFQSTTTEINNIHTTPKQIYLKKISEILNSYEKNLNFKQSFK